MYFNFAFYNILSFLRLLYLPAYATAADPTEALGELGGAWESLAGAWEEPGRSLGGLGGVWEVWEEPGRAWEEALGGIWEELGRSLGELGGACSRERSGWLWEESGS